jgi:hypothetical protein
MPEPERDYDRNRSAGPTREASGLADVVEMLLDKGVVINADIAVSVGETELLGVHIRAALASFETAAEYGLQFPDGTDPRRVEQASGRPPLDEGEEADDGTPISVRRPGSAARSGPSERPGDGRPESERPHEDDGESNDAEGDDTDDGEAGADDESGGSSDDADGTRADEPSETTGDATGSGDGDGDATPDEGAGSETANAEGTAGDER